MLGTVLDWIQELGTRNVFGNMPLVFLSFLLKMYVYYIYISSFTHTYIHKSLCHTIRKLFIFTHVSVHIFCASVSWLTFRIKCITLRFASFRLKHTLQ